MADTCLLCDRSTYSRGLCRTHITYYYRSHTLILKRMGLTAAIAFEKSELLSGRVLEAKPKRSQRTPWRLPRKEVVT
jgi:hypothetical protein